MNENIKILDCTLRDGGYVNDWNFGEKTIKAISSKLAEAGIEIVECGFLTQTKTSDKNKSIFNSIEEINNTLVAGRKKTSFACMINYGEYNIDDIPAYVSSGVDTIRVAFHKKDLVESLNFCEKIKAKGYKTFVQPMVTDSYSDTELNLLIEKANAFKPYALYMVDSFGTMRKEEVLSLYKLLDENLDKEIAIGFHSHNNLQLSFSNSQELIEAKSSRELIIDSSVFGMGRGAGNLCTELLTLYLNENFDKKYQLLPILEIIDDYLNPIFIKSPWGYSVPYYIASVNHCHPNYASYLVDKQTLNVKAINAVLSQIPADKKQLYDKKMIESLYIQHQERAVNDSESKKIIAEKLRDREVLILAPGQSLKKYQDKITAYISAHKPIVWAINFIPAEYNADIFFINNMKRFASDSVLKQETKGKTVVLTSNISDADKNFIQIDYQSYINPLYDELDNAGIMLLRFLKSIGQKKITIAGYDGFTINPHENYYSDEMMNAVSAETIRKRNDSVSEQLKELSSEIQIEFLTPSLYL